MGIEQERFVDVSQELLCCICAGVLEDPVESPCRHVFCSECISTWLNTRASCPNCRKKMLASELKPALPLVKNIIAKLQIRCDFVELGCKETVDLELFKTHCNSCQFAPISCGNEGCGMNFQRKDKDFHESVCPYRRVICSEGCGLNVSFSDLGNHNCVESLKCLIKDMEVQFSTKIEQLSVKVSALEEIVNSLKERPAVEQPRPQSQRDNDSELVLSFSETDDPLWSPRHENIPGLNVQVDSDSHSDDSIYYQPHNFLRTMNNARLLVDHVNQMQQDVGQGVQTQSTSQRERSRSRSPLRLVPHRNQRRHQESNIQRRGGLSHSSGMPHSSHSNNNESLGTLARRRRRRRQPRPERVSLDGTENNSLHDSSDHQMLNHRRSSSGNSSNVVSVVVPNDHSGRDPDESQYRDSQSSSPSSDSASSDYSSSTSFEGLDSPQAWIRDTLSPIAVSGDSSCSLSS